MKNLKLLSLCIMSCILIACNEQPEIPAPDPMKEKADFFASCLTDNYNVGDSVYFKTWSGGDIEGFVVKLNSFHELTYTPEQPGDDPENEIDGEGGDSGGKTSSEVRIEGYQLHTILQSNATKLDVTLEVVEEDGKIYADGLLVINNKYDGSESYVNNNEENVSIITGHCFCDMKKNVGIVRFYDKDNTWLLAE